MRKIIKDRAVVENDLFTLRLAEEQDPATVVVPGGRVLVPLAVWLAQRDALAARADVGVWIGSAERPEVLKDDVARLAVIGVDFPKFADGRGYSIAYNLRVRLGYQGELRALGDVLRDQLFYMQRVGFNAFEVRADRDVHDALKGLSDFTEPYQNSVDRPAPLFARIERGVSSDVSREIPRGVEAV